MPLQNRVTPFGEVVAIGQRGLFTGNRGIIHDPTTKTLLTKRWATKTWLVCTCAYNGRRREVMNRRSWTELFFLDEAVALAAGHRPCFLCRRDDAERFRICWAASREGMRPTAAQMDRVLHGERLERGRKRLHAISTPIEDLPDGAVVAVGSEAFTLRGGRSYRWAETGYIPSAPLERADRLVTPPSTLAALKAGYAPVFHPSANATSNRPCNARSV